MSASSALSCTTALGANARIEAASASTAPALAMCHWLDCRAPGAGGTCRPGGGGNVEGCRARRGLRAAPAGEGAGERGRGGGARVTWQTSLSPRTSAMSARHALHTTPSLPGCAASASTTPRMPPPPATASRTWGGGGGGGGARSVRWLRQAASGRACRRECGPRRGQQNAAQAAVAGQAKGKRRGPARGGVRARASSSLHARRAMLSRLAECASGPASGSRSCCSATSTCGGGAGRGRGRGILVVRAAVRPSRRAAAHGGAGPRRGAAAGAPACSLGWPPPLAGARRLGGTGCSCPA